MTILFYMFPATEEDHAIIREYCERVRPDIEPSESDSEEESDSEQEDDVSPPLPPPIPVTIPIADTQRGNELVDEVRRLVNDSGDQLGDFEKLQKLLAAIVEVIGIYDESARRSCVHLIEERQKLFFNVMTECNFNTLLDDLLQYREITTNDGHRFNVAKLVRRFYETLHDRSVSPDRRTLNIVAIFGEIRDSRDNNAVDFVSHLLIKHKRNNAEAFRIIHNLSGAV